MDEQRRLATNAVEAFGLLTPESPLDISSLLGGQLLGWDMELRVGGSSPTDAKLQSWGQNIRAYFAGRTLAVTGLISNVVLGWAFEEIAGEAGARELLITIRFVGFEEPLVNTVA